MAACEVEVEGHFYCCAHCASHSADDAPVADRA